MPIFFLLVGTLLVVVGINDKIKELSGLVREDFKPTDGSAGFASWIVAIFILGALGYAKTFKPISNALLVLVVIVMVLSNKGFFDNFTKAIK